MAGPMPSDPRLAALPALRKLAEEEAHDYWASVRQIVPTAAPWEQTPAYGKDVQIRARLILLSDLTRPASRDAVARLVAPRLAGGCNIGWLIEAIEGGSSDSLSSEKWRHARRYAGVTADAPTPGGRCALIALAILGASDAS